MSADERALDHVRELHVSGARRARAVARRAHELELSGDGEAAEEVGGEDRRAFEYHDHHQRRLDVGIHLGDLPAQLAHPPCDPLRADHRPRRLGLLRNLPLPGGERVGERGVDQTPTGCQTVFISMKAVMREGLSSSAGYLTTRLTLSAAAFSISVTSSGLQP